MKTYAKVIADSVSPHGERVTTFEVCFHRFVLAEVNTHRIFSRNSASSRAIPLHKQIYKVEHDAAIPVVWPAEQKGMQGGEPLSEDQAADALKGWLDSADDAVIGARRLGALGVHKSLANRLLEPFQMHTAVITATGWENFFVQRCSPLAQPEIRVAAEAMKEAYDASTPTLLHDGMWHLPYIDREDITAAEEYAYTNADLGSNKHNVTLLLVRMSAARCARVSYETQDGKRDVSMDMDLYNRLVTATPWHGSPLEHPCTPDPTNRTVATLAFVDINGQEQYVERVIPLIGNFIGFRQLRAEVEVALGLEPLR